MTHMPLSRRGAGIAVTLACLLASPVAAQQEPAPAEAPTATTTEAAEATGPTTETATAPVAETAPAPDAAPAITATPAPPSSTAPKTMDLNPGFMARRNVWDWLFALILLAGTGFAWVQYGSAMDGYEKGILLLTTPSLIAMGWFWRPLQKFMLTVDRSSSSLSKIREVHT